MALFFWDFSEMEQFSQLVPDALNFFEDVYNDFDGRAGRIFDGDITLWA